MPQPVLATAASLPPESVGVGAVASPPPELDVVVASPPPELDVGAVASAPPELDDIGMLASAPAPPVPLLLPPVLPPAELPPVPDEEPLTAPLPPPLPLPLPLPLLLLLETKLGGESPLPQPASATQKRQKPISTRDCTRTSLARISQPW
jgi:hypothetical protein